MPPSHYELIASSALKKGEKAATGLEALTISYRNLFNNLKPTMPHVTKLNARDHLELTSAVEDYRDACEQTILETARQYDLHVRQSAKNLRINIAEVKAELEKQMLHSSLSRKLGARQATQAAEHFENGLKEFHRQLIAHPTWQKIRVDFVAERQK